MADAATPLKSELASTATLPADPMTDLIKQINEAHQEVRLALRRTGECAIKAGATGIYTLNTKDFRRVRPEWASRILEP